MIVINNLWCVETVKCQCFDSMTYWSKKNIVFIITSVSNKIPPFNVFTALNITIKMPSNVFVFSIYRYIYWRTSHNLETKELSKSVFSRKVKTNYTNNVITFILNICFVYFSILTCSRS